MCYLQVLWGAGILWLLMPLPVYQQSQGVPVCSGTMNKLSISGTPEMHYTTLKNMYEGCEIVMSNLEITYLENNRDISFLRSIREVMGYVLIAINQVDYLPLENLRVIRGTSLFEDHYALTIMLNYQKDGTLGLRQLGMTHLTEILEGGVKIKNNAFLYYALTIDWKDIVKETANITLDSKKIGYGKCHPSCNNKCWGPDENECQTLTKKICAPQCNGRCFGTSPNECCHIECAGGCSGQQDTDCFACSHFNDSGACVPNCPWPRFYNKQTYQEEPNPNAKYQYGSICVSQCPPNFVVYDSSCVRACPNDMKEVEKNGMKQCVSCGGPCPKTCKGTGSSNRQTVDSSNIDSFRNCTKIQGNLHFLTTGIDGDPWHNISALNPEKLKVFETVREITGCLSIQSWPKQFNDFSVFRNLTTIRGRTLYQGFSLLIMKLPNVTSLGLRSLREISAGKVYISDNKQLCYHYTINWTTLMKSPAKQGTDIKNNRPYNDCTSKGQLCDPLCSSAGCWGPGPDQCLSCQNFSRGGTCVPECHFTEGDIREYATNLGECLPCHPECEHIDGQPSCKGQGPDACASCAHFKDGPHCVESCPQGIMAEKGPIFKFADAEHRCEPCHPNCTLGCKGPNLEDCSGIPEPIISNPVTAIVLGVIASLIVLTSVFVLCVLYQRGLAIRRKRAMRRYLESGEGIEPLDPSEKGTRVHTRLFKPTELRKIKLLGSGIFGTTVHKGVWIPEGDTVKIPVAIKTIQDRTGRQTFHEITDHMLFLGSLEHAYIVRVLGICPGDSLMLITQLSTHGSLLQHIKQKKDSLSSQRLLNWCVQIAKGMAYLEEQRLVHSNLAARNVLLKSDFIVQISDFGIADLLYPDDKKYFYNDIKKTPIKWMALESIHFRKYTHQSDVWSYGVTVWEMMSFGDEPYAGIRPQEVPELLEKGERLSQPSICTIDVYMVMVKCWMIDENVRPTFKEIASEFTRMARDPSRFLVIKRDSSIADPYSEESPQRMKALKDKEYEMDEQDNISLENMASGYLYQPSTHTLTRNHNSSQILFTSNSPAGYMTMTNVPGVETIRQVSLFSRSRNGSARTQSESSEGHGTVSEAEMNEDGSLVGSMRRTRRREDSAYHSQRISLTLPSEPEDSDDDDYNGYVMPGVSSSTERDCPLSFYGSQNSTLPRSKASRGRILKGKSEQKIPDDYEYMNKQSRLLGLVAGSASSELPQLQKEERVEYEYMDTSSAATDSADPLGATSVKDDHTTSEEEEDYKYMNKQPRLTKSLLHNQTKPQPGIAICENPTQELISASPSAENPIQEHQEYEEMDRIVVSESPEFFKSTSSLSVSPPMYQNFPKVDLTIEKGKNVNGFVKVRAGCEPGQDHSFDNPAYWHSRLFQKPDPLRT
ncbi:receptor tyrosine-protein kinase erbB-3a isoform X2 [Polypterus senegalus]|uniref:receptor tyrosine-protein kinase erbB-3a isoform X2 n=1 Tax=Polypterus senegalus TaxID=55291 RepID=UPI001965AF67|nr:receptor tyrosine-protein kinase erbB-3a isoform X2 [Polypterus senegalus]